jgi:hypothetical protein
VVRSGDESLRGREEKSVLHFAEVIERGNRKYWDWSVRDIGYVGNERGGRIYI